MKRCICLMLCLVLLAVVPLGCGRVDVSSARPEATDSETPVPADTPEPSPTPAPEPGAYQGRLIAGCTHLIGVFEDGALAAAGENNGMNGAAGCCDVEDWTDIAAVAAGKGFTLGLKQDGSIVLCGERQPTNHFQREEWQDLCAVAAGDDHIAGLRTDGTVVGAGSNSQLQLTVGEWTDIAALALGGEHTVGLKRDGTVVACGKNNAGQCDVTDWTDITAIAAHGNLTMGLRRDGTVVASGGLQSYVENWKDIVAIALGVEPLGLTADGHVLTAGYQDWEKVPEQIAAWENVIAIAAGYYAAALFADGSVQVVGRKDWDGMQEAVTAWNLWETRPEDTPAPETPAPAESEPQTADEHSALLTVDGESIVVTFDGTGRDDDGKLTVILSSPAFRSLQIRNGQAYIGVWASAVCGGESIKARIVDWKSGVITFRFSTDLEPETVVVYPNGGSEADGVRFDAATRTRLD